MSGWIVQCRSCGFAWPRTVTLSVYERESLESRPCPRCAAYTLSCHKPVPKKPLKRKPAREDSNERRVG
jgi:hypothetical protein